MLQYLKQESNKTFTENGAATLQSTLSDCLDLFATIGALRRQRDDEIIARFMRAFTEDKDIANQPQVSHSEICHDSLYQPRQSRNAALEQRHGNGGKHSTLTQRGCHCHDDHQVKHSLSGKDGVVAQNTILDRTDNGHCANTHRQ